MDERQEGRAGRAAAGTVADEAARLIDALGAWATSASPTAGTTTAGATSAPPAAEHGREGTAHGTGPEAPRYDDPAASPYEDPAASPDDHPGTAGRGGDPDGSSRCEHCGAGTGVGRSISCQVCPICQGIALLRAVRPETVDRLADLAGALAATLRDVAASGRTTDGDHRRPGGTAAGAHDPAWGASAAGGRATVQDIPVHDGETTDEGDEL
jgi:hypothetical protein